MRAVRRSNQCGDPFIEKMATDAIERNLQIIGEAASQLPPEFTKSIPEIPWPQIRGFRNILVHQYFGVDSTILSDIIANHLPQLASATVASG